MRCSWKVPGFLVVLLCVGAASCSRDIAGLHDGQDGLIQATGSHRNSLGPGDYVCGTVSISVDVNPVDVGDTTHWTGSGSVCNSSNTVIYTGDLSSYPTDIAIEMDALPDDYVHADSPSGNVIVGTSVGSNYVHYGVCGSDAGLSYGHCNWSNALTLTVVAGLSATVSGPSMVPEGSSNTYDASVGGGYTPYTYSWGGLMSGSGSSATGTINSSDYVTLNVWDAHGHHVSTNLHVTACPWPQFTC